MVMCKKWTAFTIKVLVGTICVDKVGHTFAETRAEVSMVMVKRIACTGSYFPDLSTLCALAQFSIFLTELTLERKY